MTTYELIAYSTESVGPGSVRYRDYTTSLVIANRFNAIPKIQFTDSGHGVVFCYRIHEGKRGKVIKEIRDYVDKHMKFSASQRGE